MATNIDDSISNSFEALNLDVELKYLPNNGAEHQDLLVNGLKLRFNKQNGKGSVYYKCRNKDEEKKSVLRQ